VRIVPARKRPAQDGKARNVQWSARYGKYRVVLRANHRVVFEQYFSTFEAAKKAADHVRGNRKQYASE
jgi:uncharacterized protein YegP (UPF0339 family)